MLFIATHMYKCSIYILFKSVIAINVQTEIPRPIWLWLCCAGKIGEEFGGKEVSPHTFITKLLVFGTFFKEYYQKNSHLLFKPNPSFLRKISTKQ